MTTRSRWATMVVMALGACNTGTSLQMSHVSVRLTDAPGPAIASAVVWVSRVELVGGSGGPFVITQTGGQFDLLDFQNGVTTLLGDGSIPAGDYEQLRLIVDSARITLVSDTFSDGSMTKALKVPSGSQSGLKVNFGGPVHIAPPQTALVVDFDVSRSFVFQGTSGGPISVSFKPVLHGSVADVAGSISGTSSPASANGVLFAINGTDTVATAAADANNGAYTLLFLPPATYTVADSSTVTGHNAPSQSVVVGPGAHVTGVDFTIP
jgi:hypothetical protein